MNKVYFVSVERIVIIIIQISISFELLMSWYKIEIYYCDIN